MNQPRPASHRASSRFQIRIPALASTADSLTGNRRTITARKADQRTVGLEPSLTPTPNVLTNGRRIASHRVASHRSIRHRVANHRVIRHRVRHRVRQIGIFERSIFSHRISRISIGHSCVYYTCLSGRVS